MCYCPAVRQAGIQHGGQHYYLGLHENELDAAAAYKKAKEQINQGTFKARKKKEGDALSKSSKFRGVRWQRQQKKWYAGLQFKGAHHYLGFYPTEEEAARAYDRKSRELRGKHALCNMPNEGERKVGEGANGKRKRKKKVKQEPGANGAGGGVPTSAFLGVSWCRKTNKWKAQIRILGKMTSLGTFDDEEKAAEAYDRKVVEVRGAKAKTNFPAQDASGQDAPAPVKRDAAKEAANV